MVQKLESGVSGRKPGRTNGQSNIGIKHKQPTPTNPGKNQNTHSNIAIKIQSTKFSELTTGANINTPGSGHGAKHLHQSAPGGGERCG